MLYGTPQERGQLLEDMVGWLINVYEREDIGFFYHHGTQATMAADQWIPELSLPDYGGVCFDGSGVMFDAKVTAKNPYRHDPKRNHQLQTLWRFHRIGGHAFLLVLLDTPDETKGYVVYPQRAWGSQNADYRFVADLKAKGTATPCPAHPSFDQYVPDWIQVLKRLKRLP